MSDLFAVAYADEATAREARATLERLMTAHLVELDDAVVVTRSPDGKVRLHQATSMAGTGAAGGALWGGLIGLVFLAPVLGMALGAAAGGAAGAIGDYGVDDDFLRELGAHLAPGGAALIVLVRRGTPDKVLPEMRKLGGHLIQTSLSHERETELRAALGESHAGSPA